MPFGRSRSVSYGNVTIDEQNKLWLNNCEVELGRRQHDLVEALVRARGRPLTREFLLHALGIDAYDDAVTQYVKRAREKLRIIDPKFDQIECLRGFGAYRWQHQGLNHCMARN